MGLRVRMKVARHCILRADYDCNSKCKINLQLPAVQRNKNAKECDAKAEHARVIGLQVQQAIVGFCVVQSIVEGHLWSMVCVSCGACVYPHHLNPNVSHSSAVSCSSRIKRLELALVSDCVFFFGSPALGSNTSFTNEPRQRRNACVCLYMR